LEVARFVATQRRNATESKIAREGGGAATDSDEEN